MKRKFTDNATTILALNINTTDTSITVAGNTGSLFPVLDVGETCICTLTDLLTGTYREKVLVTAVSGDTFTVTRGYDGSTARAYLAGDRFELLITADMANHAAFIDQTNTFTQDQYGVTAPAGDKSLKFATTEFVAGSIGGFQKYMTVTANTNLASTDKGSFVECQGTSAFTLTLPNPVGLSGASLAIYNNSTRLQTILTPSGNLVGFGQNQQTMLLNTGSVIQVVSDGTNWVIYALDQYVQRDSTNNYAVDGGVKAVGYFANQLTGVISIKIKDLVTATAGAVDLGVMKILITQDDRDLSSASNPVSFELLVKGNMENGMWYNTQAVLIGSSGIISLQCRFTRDANHAYIELGTNGLTNWFWATVDVFHVASYIIAGYIPKIEITQQPNILGIATDSSLTIKSLIDDLNTTNNTTWSSSRIYSEIQANKGMDPIVAAIVFGGA